MAKEIPGFLFSREAAANYSAKQFYFMAIDGNGRAVLPTADGQLCAAVLQNDPLQYEAATLMGNGISKVVSNGTVENGDRVATANGGKAKEAAAGEYIQGIALEGDGGVDGTVITVLLLSAGKEPA